MTRSFLSRLIAKPGISDGPEMGYGKARDKAYFSASKLSNVKSNMYTCLVKCTNN